VDIRCFRGEALQLISLSTSCQGIVLPQALTSNSIAELIHKTHCSLLTTHLNFVRGKCIPLFFWLLANEFSFHWHGLPSIVSAPTLFRFFRFSAGEILVSSSTYWNITNVWLPLGLGGGPWTDPEPKKRNQSQKIDVRAVNIFIGYLRLYYIHIYVRTEGKRNCKTSWIWGLSSAIFIFTFPRQILEGRRELKSFACA